MSSREQTRRLGTASGTDNAPVGFRFQDRQREPPLEQEKREKQPSGNQRLEISGTAGHSRFELSQRYSGFKRPFKRRSA